MVPKLVGTLVVFVLRWTRLEEYHFQKFSNLIVAASSEPASSKLATFFDVRPLSLTTVPSRFSTFQLATATEDRLDVTELQTVHSESFAIPEDKAILI